MYLIRTHARQSRLVQSNTKESNHGKYVSTNYIITANTPKDARQQFGRRTKSTTTPTPENRTCRYAGSTQESGYIAPGGSLHGVTQAISHRYRASNAPHRRGQATPRCIVYFTRRVTPRITCLRRLLDCGVAGYLLLRKHFAGSAWALEGN